MRWSQVLVILFIVINAVNISCSTVNGSSPSRDVGQDERLVVNVSKRHKRYALEGSRWRTNEITYRISKYSDKLSKDTVDKIIRKAFNIWSKATNLKFVQKKTGKVQIDIKFDRRNHGDDAPFDGEGGQRAHAFFPRYGGDAHFDDDENWTLDQTNSNDGSRLLLVATHELGHALGIGHSEKKDALMAPSHDEWKGDVKLNIDDIKAIQALYGAKGEGRPEAGDPNLGRGPGPNGPSGGPGGRPPFGPPHGPGGPQFGPPTGGQPPLLHGPHGGGPQLPPGGGQGPPLGPPPPPPQSQPRRLPPTRRRPSVSSQPSLDNSDAESFDDYVDDNDIEDIRRQSRNRELCQNGFDTILTMKNDDTYVFKDRKYWKLTETAVAEGYPRNIAQDWDGLPGHLDAAFTWTNGKMYFFKGDRYWRFSANKKMDKGFPKQLTDGFEGIPNNVDAAFVWGKNDKIYFFKGSQYYKFDPKKNPPVEESYPRPISNWDGIPNNLDAALQYSNGATYFFRDGQYYRFNEETNAVDTQGQSYPRNTGQWWFGCRPDTPRKLTKAKDQRFVLD